MTSSTWYPGRVHLLVGALDAHVAARLLHGAPPNNSKASRRRAYLQRWTGADVTYNPRPDLQRMLRDPGIAPGDPLDCDLFPLVWHESQRQPSP